MNWYSGVVWLCCLVHDAEMHQKTIEIVGCKAPMRRRRSGVGGELPEVEAGGHQMDVAAGVWIDGTACHAAKHRNLRTF